VARFVDLRRGVYRDSVQLLQVSQVLRGVPGVSAALVAMATELNLDLAAGMGFTPPPGATPNDLVVAIGADDESALATAVERLDAELRDSPVTSGSPAETPPRSVGAAVRRASAGVVLVSTPGRYAVLDALDALDAGASVMVFSDNVPVAQEVLLKERAAERGLLVMGPDCGTALVGGVGLGFANVVPPGPVGLVAASGTGAQQVMCLLDAGGVGVSHCLGVGGRDLSAAVAGRSTLAALDALDADPVTDLIVLVSKPPDPEVATRVGKHAATLRTPVVPALLGPGQPDLTAAVERVLGALGRAVPSWPSWHPAAPAPSRPGLVHGLFAGGTLRDEAAAIIGEKGRLVDLGADEYTLGRPHPMIDNTLRLEHLAAAAADPSCGVLLLDVVLGHAADPDPAGTLAPAIATCGLPVVVALIGTVGDPQGLERQAEALRDAGATVFLSNAEAARHAVRAL
jgi:FdrA protein